MNIYAEKCPFVIFAKPLVALVVCTPGSQKLLTFVTISQERPNLRNESDVVIFLTVVHFAFHFSCFISKIACEVKQESHNDAS